MKRIVSIFGAIFLIFGNSMIASMFPKQGQTIVGLVCISLGAVLSVISITEEERRLSRIRELFDSLRISIEEADKNAGRNEKIIADQLQTIQEKLENDLKESVDIIHADILKGNVTREKMQSDISGIGKMPERMYQMQDELIGKIEAYTIDNNKEIAELSENIHDENAILLKEIKKDLRDIIDSIDDYEGRMSQEIEKLSQQYQEFKDYNNEIIKKMTLMSNEDYELLKGLFDGKKNKRN